MKYTLLFCAFLLCGSTALYNCSSSSPEASVSADQKTSELALLMRDMWDEMDSVKKSINAGTTPIDVRAKFKSIHTAQPTDMSFKTEPFAIYASDFDKKLDALYREGQTQAQQIEHFNILVESCVACHTVYCNGPIKRIRKLNIPKM